MSTSRIIVASSLSSFTAPSAPVVTWNPADKGANIALAGADLIAYRSGGSGYDSVRATHSRNSGKRYAEGKVIDASSASMMIGFATSGAGLSTYVGGDINGWGYNASNGNVYTNGSQGALFSAYAQNDIIGLAYDAATGQIWFAKNNAWLGGGNPGAGTGQLWSITAGTALFPQCSLHSTGTAGQKWQGNFRAVDQVYAPPSGFSPWE